jgi:hypothetical protein
MNIETLDCLYLSEPVEQLLQLYKDPKEINMRLGHAIAFCEEMVQEGKIKSYGIQGAQSFLIDPMLEAVRAK